MLERARRAVGPLGHIEDDGVGVKLRRGVAVHWTGGVVLELGGNELAGRFGGMIAADPRLGVLLQFRSERDGDSFAVGHRAPAHRRRQAQSKKPIWVLKRSHPIRRGARRILPSSHRLSDIGGTWRWRTSWLPVRRVLPLGEPGELLGSHGAGQTELFGELSLPLAGHGFVRGSNSSGRER